MERTLISTINKNFIGKEVKMMGWVHKVRKLGKIAFVILRDRSGLIQCIADIKNIDISGLKIESVVTVTGEVKNKEGKNDDVEVFISCLKAISEVKEDLPIELNKEKLEANLDTILSHRALSLRNIKTNAIFKIQAALSQGFREFLRKEEFTEIFTSKIVAEGTEGGTELFELKYFDRKAYLAQSPQFAKQMMVGAGYERVFEIGHVYRAEEHNTNRHLNEYVSMDLEMGFIEDEKEIMALETGMLKWILEFIKQECSKEIEILEIELPIIKDKIPELRLLDAIEILKQVYGKHELIADIDPEGEKLIGKHVKEKYNSDFVFLTHYPLAKRPMYTMPAEENLTHSFDLLFKGLEITTGGQRIHNYQMLKNSISSRGLNVDSYSGYLEIFKYGMPPHGGLAIGLERLTAQLVGLKNVREATLFPRDRDRIAP